ncbi:hypothetical protein K1719_013154 [Acacia pycnantha]|nr:hypothetical protein K1719_013154 [Acacia pycnantha]
MGKPDTTIPKKLSLRQMILQDLEQARHNRDMTGEASSSLSKARDKECRICHKGLQSDWHVYGVPIELGCSCKHDLATAYKLCAET